MKAWNTVVDVHAWHVHRIEVFWHVVHGICQPAHMETSEHDIHNFLCE